MPAQSRVLRAVLDRVASTARVPGARTPVVVFDLDQTLCDNRPRTLEILGQLREELMGSQPDVADAVGTVTADHVEYLLSDTLRGCGVTSSSTIASITRYWHERFFTDEYLRLDVPLDGAVEYVRACHEAGAIVVYLTNRDLPGMFLGTVQSLRDHGFPIGVAAVELILKPDANLPDEAFKRGALPTLDRVGEVVAFFDNEPANCNIAQATYPEAMVVLLETQRVPYAPEPAPGVVSASDFRL